MKRFYLKNGAKLTYTTFSMKNQINFTLLSVIYSFALYEVNIIFTFL